MTRTELAELLLAQRNDDGHWEGRLSSSALATATAITALHLADPTHPLIAAGADWLRQTRNADGGWGDTPASPSNISTTALAWAALSLVGNGDAPAEAWIGDTTPDVLSARIVAAYGSDRTFSVPILTMLAIAGRVEWRHVPQLPFELAAFPRQWFGALRLPVVSYAIPALIAIGLVRHHHRPRWWNPLRPLVRGRVLRILREVQPDSGGYLEATPLTSFVCMSLLSAGLDSEVLDDGLEFLRCSARADGSWPIDSDLATWVTTLAVKALGDLPPEDGEGIREWLLGQQYREVHPYTMSPPGGWAWTDLPGGVPDADDTPGALLALRHLGITPESTDAARMAVRWLLDLQNGDGGIPTFCRGWGRLPFDRSGPDLTAHTLSAWAAWRDDLPELADAIDLGTGRALDYLKRQQRADGSWLPLWFGNQHQPDHENPVYGTACVLLGINELPQAAEMAASGASWLASVAHPDGGWGGDAGCPPTLEESGIALAALAPHAAHRDVCARAVEWLEAQDCLTSSPIGLYFARLWYDEELYPAVLALRGLTAWERFSSAS